jgi:hypothetical protein
MHGRKRRWLLALAGLLLLAAGVVTVWPQPERITRENFERIREGMTRAEVEAILGPPGDYASGPTMLQPDGPTRAHVFDEDDSLPHLPPDRFGVWERDSAGIYVDYTRSGTVGVVTFSPLMRRPQSILESLRWRAERQWRRWFPE